jgi:hypothetical protein
MKVKQQYPPQKSPGPNRFTAEFHHAFKQLTPTILKLSHEIEREGTHLLDEPSVILIPKSDKDTTTKRITGQSL